MVFFPPILCSPVSAEEGEVTMAAMVSAGLSVLIASIINHSLILFFSVSVVLPANRFFRLLNNEHLPLLVYFHYLATSLSPSLCLLPSVHMVFSQDSAGFSLQSFWHCTDKHTLKHKGVN